MLDLISLGLITELFTGWGETPPPLKPIQPLQWEESALFSLPHSPEPIIKKIAENYLQDLSNMGIPLDSQGVWFASDWWTFSQHRGEISQSAASLTKIATSLAALDTYGVNYQFETLVRHTGGIEDGVLKGDLVIEGGGDPFFVWEEAIALGNRLNELGIEKISGNLIIVGDFFLNYQQNPQTSAQLFAQALNHQLWSREIQKQYKQLPSEMLRPQVQVLGNIQVSNNADFKSNKLLIRHLSLPLRDILQEMNVYSNNKMADLIARSVGGAKIVEQKVIEITQVSSEEVQLINGSGLGIDNRLSPRAVAKMLRAIQQQLESEGETMGAILPVTGINRGTVRDRAITEGIAVKTGSLWNVSALAGVISTKRHGLVYFTIINQNGNLQTFRNQQDQFLQQLDQSWQISRFKSNSLVQLGDPKRNLPVTS
ncbi:D-alanyl-D-alanine carboxypeptidase [Dactylococcopsis salina]|uniref:D-alanyl-D-alanine carboxypeptidase (Penicillin-binding protein 4) n=1 Tax=Dactylococcopsis salina (strain PCC 8305) TaxID=13035 RepID=K9Z0B3_DACS8|nr:D-alanyl-D-alanine carboxypeptidase [Dactylococcopsis salina]AFZ51803.1 D-alanyl-D-alanine carboxypeptidase (penicillin-binding protein 4) [Dactylococcopsis salina PCC 8305]